MMLKEHTLYNFLRKIFGLLLISGLFFTVVAAFYAQAKPKTKTIHGYSLDGFARTKIKNETIRDLACWIAIDGHKYKFRLPALTESKWYTATSKNYNYANVHTWCDYIDFHPKYQQYNRG